MSARILSGRDTASGNFVEIEVEAGLIRNARISENDRQSAIDSWLSPGFVDLQVNGYRGYDLNAADVEPEEVIGLTLELLAVGVTTFLPTIITASEEQIVASLRAIACARQMDAAVAEAIPFAHLEGPHIDPEEGARGAHPLEHVRAPDLAEFDRWQAVSGCPIGLVTLSPHWPGAQEYIAGLKVRGVRVAIGHTHATSEEISAAVDAGATLSTHLGNGIASMLPRHPNPIWTQLADDRLWASLIADGHHLPAETLKVILRAKGIERCILVSDAVALAGLPTGIYQAPIGGKVEVHADGRLNMAGTNMLAGSGSSMKDDIAYLVRSGLTSLGDAVRMATINPARFLGQSAELTVGAQANIVQFCMDEVSGKIEIQSVIAGKRSFHAR